MSQITNHSPALANNLADEDEIRMFLTHSLKCTECGGDAGAIISPTAHLDALHTLEFICVECVEKIAKSEAVTLDSETSWGKVIARIKGR